ncbi:MAG: hypothetical protein SVT56_10720, partial [Chloroflexota bacterium]|nr:hypothetical protein [Chloroflexota bacterium]
EKPVVDYECEPDTSPNNNPGIKRKGSGRGAGTKIYIDQSKLFQWDTVEKSQKHSRTPGSGSKKHLYVHHRIITQDFIYSLEKGGGQERPYRSTRHLRSLGVNQTGS